jgi:DNA-binding transcriptional MerR regulator
MAKQWTLRELAADTGVPERTIRFYISRELLDPPLKAGRGAAYGPKHKARLNEIRKLQAGGLMLAEIAQALVLKNLEGTKIGLEYNYVNRIHLRERGPWGLETLGESGVALSDEALAVGAIPAPAELAAVPKSVIWRSYSVEDDVVVMIRAEASPWRTKKLLNALRRFAAEIKDETIKEDKGE